MAQDRQALLCQQFFLGLFQLFCPRFDHLLETMGIRLELFFRSLSFGDVVDDGKQAPFSVKRDRRGMDLYIPDPSVGQAMLKPEPVAFSRQRGGHFPLDVRPGRLIDLEYRYIGEGIRRVAVEFLRRLVRLDDFAGFRIDQQHHCIVGFKHSPKLPLAFL